MKFILEKLIPLPMLEVSHEDSEIWEADSFVFGEGERFLVEAASGKGKTSLLSVLYGLRHDFNGRFLIDDRESVHYSIRDWSRLRKEKVSYIFQGLELFDDLTAMENILLKNRISNYKEKNEIISLAERLGVEAFLGKKCGFMSFGQRQRIAIIRALCQPFEYLFADECFSHIDRNNSSIAMEVISEECEQRGAGMILTSLGNNHSHFKNRITL